MENSIETKMKECGIPLRYVNASFDKIENIVESKQMEIVAWCFAYCKNFDDMMVKGTSAIFTGNTGTGKTMIAASMVRELLNFNPIYIDMYSLFLKIKDSFNFKDIFRYVSYKLYIECNLLIIDEFDLIKTFNPGNENDLMIIESIFRIINIRYENLKSTIIISNSNESELESVLGSKLIDRFHENYGALFVFDWKSYRRK